MEISYLIYCNRIHGRFVHAIIMEANWRFLKSGNFVWPVPDLRWNSSLLVSSNHFVSALWPFQNEFSMLVSVNSQRESFVNKRMSNYRHINTNVCFFFHLPIWKFFFLGFTNRFLSDIKARIFAWHPSHLIYCFNQNRNIFRLFIKMKFEC